MGVEGGVDAVVGVYACRIALGEHQSSAHKAVETRGVGMLWIEKTCFVHRHRLHDDQHHVSTFGELGII